MKNPIEHEREKQETNEELDAFLESVQRELALFKHQVQQLRRPKKKARIRPAKPAKFDVAELRREIGKLKELILCEEETNTLINTHPSAKPTAVAPDATDADSAKAAEKAAALDRFITEVRRQVAIKRARKTDALAIVSDQQVANAILDFYIIYAVFIEYFNNMKVLYQVMLAEYEVIGALPPKQIGALRAAAVARITTHLCRQSWLGEKAGKHRREFRQSMLKVIRRALAQRASIEVNKKKQFPPLSALCLSGGGIRSATFGLGVIQALARHGMLDKFDYLSTVSGGGYIGSWLSAWAAREPNGIVTVQNLLSHRLRQRVEASEVTHLRSFSNYMSPRTGLLSADTWTLIGVYLRNLTLNWLVALPLLAAFLLLPRLFLEIVYNGQAFVGTGPTLSAGFVTIGSSLFGCLAMFGLTVFRPSLSKFLQPDSWFQQRFCHDDVGSLKNMDVTVLFLCVVPMMLFAMGITTYGYWLGQSPERQEWVAKAQAVVSKYPNRYFVLGGLIAIFIALAATNLFYHRKRRMEGGWDKFFGTVVIAISILVGILQLVFPQDLMLFNLVVFTNLIFIVGFVAARAYIVRQSMSKRSREGLWDNVSIEFSMSFLAASMGGLLLYAVNDWFRSLQPGPHVYATVAVPLFVGVFMAAATFFVGIGSKILDDIDREWASRFGAWLLVAIIGWLAVFGIVLVGPAFFARVNQVASEWIISAGGLAGIVSGAITLLFGYYANNGAAEERKPVGKRNFLFQIAPQIAAPIFAVFLLILIVLGTNSIMRFVGNRLPFMDYEFAAGPWPNPHGAVVIFLWILIFAAVGCLMGWWINVNKFSLHAAYRDRLIRAFLGASRATERLETANSFIGLDERDNIEMHRLRPRPFHVINMTLNTAASSTLRWQTRKSESFTVTPLHCGSSNMGNGSGTYRSAKLFGADKIGRAISLGTAAAISGAAASPNMGYYTQSAAVSGLMALFNVRLGWWLGNPGRRGDHTFYKNAPEFSPKLFFYEALGRTVDTNKYVYLSDGGHFENLGLYEMVLRRCRFIVLSDAGADEGFGFSDLGSAIHKIRVDMGIPIEFVDGELPVEGRSCSIANIRYSCVDSSREEDDGILIYIKPTLDGCEPADLVHYSRKHPNFPHESTADQWFGELQFESYRSLGVHMIDAIWGSAHVDECSNGCPSLSAFLGHARANVAVFRDGGKRGKMVSGSQGNNLSNPP